MQRLSLCYKCFMVFQVLRGRLTYQVVRDYTGNIHISTVKQNSQVRPVAYDKLYAGVKFAPFSSLLYTRNPKALTRKGCKFDFCQTLCILTL